MRADLIESRERLFFSMQPSGQGIFADAVRGQSHSLKRAIEYFVDATTYLARFLSEWAYFFGNVFRDTPFAYLEQKLNTIV